MRNFLEVNQTKSAAYFFIKVFLVISIIVLLPAVINPMLRSMNTYGAATMLIRAVILPLAAVLGGVVLFFITSRRLRDLNLSKVSLWAFPIWPILLLASGPIQFFFGGWLVSGNQNFHPYLSPTIWLGNITVIILSIIIPNADEKVSWRNNLYLLIKNSFDTSIKLTPQGFQKAVGTLFGLMILVFLIVLGVQQIFRPSYLLMMPFIFLQELLVLIITLRIVVLAIQRLNDLGFSYLFSGIFLMLGLWFVAIRKIVVFAIFHERFDTFLGMYPNGYAVISGVIIPAFISIALLILMLIPQPKQFLHDLMK